MSEKVVKFPAIRLRDPDAVPVRPPAAQMDLFGFVQGGDSAVAFFDINQLTESTLKALTVRNPVSAVVDLRPMPVFRRPKFNHSLTIEHFYRNNIDYIEFVMSAFDLETEWIDVDAVLSRVKPSSNFTIMMCLYDQGARDAGWVDAMRIALRRTKRFSREINPRSLPA